jgi:hypothetical protein
MRRAVAFGDALMARSGCLQVHGDRCFEPSVGAWHQFFPSMGCGEHDALGRGLLSHKLRNDAAIARDQDSIRDRQYFRQVGGDYRNRLAVVGEFTDGAMDLSVCPKSS